ncbi:hypothetical protein ACFWRZ_08570 [Streptomyces rubiginosohelvolus]|uniref:hypothetical protein n=1 Tax=Streptomyces rubiginosohelvolus TaxID=67362 RepID=UPI00365AD9BE
MSEGLQAGRLEVTVVSVLDGFARELRTKVEAAAEGLAVKVKVEVNDKGLRKRLKTAVKEASAGLTAKVHVRVDRDGLRGELEEVARRVADTDVRVPVRPDDDTTRGGGLLSRIRGLLGRAQGEADQNPVSVPFTFGGFGGRRSGRGRMRMLAMGAIVSLAQPAVAALTQYGAGLTALVSAAAPAVGVLGAIPGLILAAGTAAIATKVAFGGVGEALKQTLKAQSQLAEGTKLTKAQQQALDQSLQGLSTSARATVKTVAGLSGEWRKMKQSVQERFFSKISKEIKPLSSAVLPLLKSSLGDAAGQMGNLAKRGAQAMRSGPFARDFKTVAASNSKVVGNITDGVANLAAATGHFLVASGPFVERVGEAGEKFTRWVRASAQAGRETGSLAKFLDHAAEKAKQLGRTTVQLGKGLAGVGRAGQDAGNALLDGLEGSMIRFSRWANSAKGQVSMKKFFSDAAPTFHELNLLVGDFVRGLGKMATDTGVRDLISQIRTELMPAVGAFLDAIGGSIGPAIVSLVSNVASLFASLSSAGSGLGLILGALSGLLNLFNGLLQVVPGLGSGLGILLGAVLAFRVVAGITGMLRGLGTSIRSVGTVATTTAAGVATQTTLWQRMGAAYTTAAASGNRLTGTMRGIGGAAGAMRGGMTGLMGALGGPWGAAIAAVTIGIGLLASRHEKAAAAAREQENRVNSLARALRESSGAIDANVRAQAASLLQEAKAGDGKGKLVDRMRDAKVTLNELTKAYLGEDGGLQALQKRLEDTAAANKEVVRHGRGASVVHNDTGVAASRAAKALKSVSGELEKGMQQNKEYAEAARGAGAAGTDSYSRLSAAVQAYSDKTQSADARTNALKRALEALGGNSQSVHDATAQLNSVMLAVDGTMAGTIKKADGWGRALVANNGLVNTTTRNGQTLNSQLTELRDSMLGVATKSMEAAENGLMPMSEAMSSSESAMERTRAKALELARSFNIPAEQAKILVDEMGFVPETVTTLMSTQGIPESTAEILALRSNLESLKPGTKIEIEAPTADARAQIEALGFNVTQVPGTKKVEVTAPTAEAQQNLKILAGEIAKTPGKKQVTVDAFVNRAAADLDKVRSKVETMKGKKLIMEAPTKIAVNELQRLGFTVKGIPNSKKVQVTAPTGEPISQVRALQATIDRLRGKTVTVTTNYVVTGSSARREGAHGSQLAQANGGIVHYAEGGIRAMAGRVKAFANGAENHIAQIAKAGTWRVWAEDETGGEAYLPLAKSKRKRSEAILGKVAEMFGGMVVYPGRAPVRTFENGAVSMHRNSRPAREATAPRAAVPQGNTSALVGGDLNLNIASVGTVKNAFDDALFELRRLRLGGGG